MCSRARRGATSSADSDPRSQWGTRTGSPRTLAKPSARMDSMIQSMAASSRALPTGRFPNRSTSRTIRAYAELSASAASMIRPATSA